MESPVARHYSIDIIRSSSFDRHRSIVMVPSRQFGHHWFVSGCVAGCCFLLLVLVIAKLCRISSIVMIRWNHHTGRSSHARMALYYPPSSQERSLVDCPRSTAIGLRARVVHREGLSRQQEGVVALVLFHHLAFVVHPNPDLVDSRGLPKVETIRGRTAAMPPISSRESLHARRAWRHFSGHSRSPTKGSRWAAHPR